MLVSPGAVRCPGVLLPVSRTLFPAPLPGRTLPAQQDTREFFERERWELELHDCLRAAEKHKQDGNDLFEKKEFQSADEKYLCSLKYVEFENVFEGEVRNPRQPKHDRQWRRPARGV